MKDVRVPALLSVMILATLVIPVSASIPGYSISLSDSKDPVNPGGTLEILVTMSNSWGYSEDSPLDVVVDWTNIPGFPNNGAPFTQSGLSYCIWNGGNEPVDCTFNNVPPHGSITLSFPFTISSSAAPGTYSSSAYILQSTDLDDEETITVTETPVNVPEFPSGFLPVAMIAGILGCLFAVQRVE